MPLRGSSFSGTFGLLTAGALLAACAQTPMGPMVNVMPGPGKSFDDFQTDQMVCKSFATNAVQGQAEAANKQAVVGGALSTLVGAGLGAGIGAAAGNAGAGAAIGAGSGAVLGGGFGAQGSAMRGGGIQAQYDNAFAQCMYTKGNQVPGFTPVNAPPPPPVAYGPGPDSLVGAVQAELIRLRYLPPPADGMMGPRTSSAISSFEQARGLPVDGVPSPQLLAQLRATQY